MDHEPPCKAISMTKDLLLSWFFGVILASIFVFPFVIAASQYFNHGNDYWLRDLNILEGMLKGAFISFFGIIVTAPLMFIALLTSLIFRKSIERNLLPWCCAAPVSIWIFNGFVTAWMCDNNYCEAHSFVHVFFRKTTNIENLLYLFGPMLAAAIFYFFRRKR